MVIGYFISILNSQERVRGAKIRLYHFTDFLDYVTIIARQICSIEVIVLHGIIGKKVE